MTTQEEKHYTKASIATANNLKSIAETLLADDLSHISLPEIEKAVDIVSRMVPAGNVPGVILNNLARLTGWHSPQPQSIKRDINSLFKGVEQVLNRTAYGAAFAGPAAVIWGYQYLLKLAGKQPEDAFPRGTWQFYVDYALREDTARHANETHGFDTLLNQHGITLNHSDRVTAWVITAMQTLQHYNDLLENEWRERMYLHIANVITDGNLANAYAKWASQRPYGRRADAGNLTYPAYRRAKFDDYMQDVLRDLSPEQQSRWQQTITELERTSLPDYQQQMAICSYLEAETYSENHVDVPLEQATIGLIHRGSYYLIPLWDANNQPHATRQVRAQVKAILLDTFEPKPAHLTRLARLKRASLPGLMQQINEETRHAWQALHHAPILINTDQRPADLPLASIRQTERGLGDHALTIFDTGATFVFDQSHIYYDGSWGASLAEIMTNEALSWAQYLAALPAAPRDTSGIQALDFHWQAHDMQVIQKSPTILAESSAESNQINVQAILNLRKLFKQRSDLLGLTVNDLLVLYRAIHAVTYKPPAQLKSQLKKLAKDRPYRDAAQTALSALEDRTNPAVLIPVDASQTNPAERLYPMSFDVPLRELNLIDLHKQTAAALKAYQKDTNQDRSVTYETFDHLQREYLATLAGFGAVLTRAKEIALAGQSASSGTIRLLAHMPRPLQRLLDEIPSKIDFLNDIIKGREVFSNIGAVAPSSTLTRFITAKDDNEKKTLAWGIITDADLTMRLSLRDFRPHVGLLLNAGQSDLAQKITQNYLDTYVKGFNTFINELRRITQASRETQISKGRNDDE